MKYRFFLVLMLLILLPKVSRGQILLETRVTGSVGQTTTFMFYNKLTASHQMYTTYTWTYYNQTTMQNELINLQQTEQETFPKPCFATVVVRKKNIHGVLEFNLNSTINGREFPTSRMTASNWKAYLKGLSLTQTGYPANGLISLKLFDLDDEYEDSHLSYPESAQTPIAPILARIPESRVMLKPLDVTDALRRDLFYSEPNTTTGFKIGGPRTRGHSLQFEQQKPMVEVIFNDKTFVELGINLFVVELSKSRVNVSIYSVDNRFEPPAILRSVLLVEILGEFFFYPNWTKEFCSFGLSSGLYGQEIMEFTKPSMFTPPGEVTFWATLVHPVTNEIISNIESEVYTWDYTESNVQ